MLNREECIIVAENVIQLRLIEDQKLKNEIYLKALEFQKSDPCCGMYDHCYTGSKLICVQCLSDYLMNIARTYDKKINNFTVLYVHSDL